MSDDDWTVEELEWFQERHNPANQEDNPYERCAMCGYTRHPCEFYDLATFTIKLLKAQEQLLKAQEQL